MAHAHGDTPEPHTAYGRYRRGLALLERGSAAAAAQVLARAADDEPDSRSVLEALGRAQFGAGMYADAVHSFRRIVTASPSDDYAHFGLGLAATRSGDFPTAVHHLALASALRPDTPHYRRALSRAKAALRRSG